MVVTTQSDYAWIIDYEDNRHVPKIGPWNARSDLITLLERTDTGKRFRIISNENIIHKGRILGVFTGKEPLKDLNFVDTLDSIEYINSNGYWEKVN